MLAKLSVALLCALMAGCFTNSPAPVSEGMPQLDPVDPVRQPFTLNASLTTFGTGHVSGTYIHPNPPEPLALENHNCVSIEIAGSGIRHLNATAQWDSGERLMLFQYMKDQTGPARDQKSLVGTSPLYYDIEYPTGDQALWTFVGIAPDPDGPAAFGVDEDQTVSLQVRIDFVGDNEPRLPQIHGCSSQTG